MYEVVWYTPRHYFSWFWQKHFLFVFLSCSLWYRITKWITKSHNNSVCLPHYSQDLLLSGLIYFVVWYNPTSFTRCACIYWFLASFLVVVTLLILSLLQYTPFFLTKKAFWEIPFQNFCIKKSYFSCICFIRSPGILLC